MRRLLWVAALGVLLSSTDAFSPVQGPASFLARSLAPHKNWCRRLPPLTSSSSRPCLGRAKPGSSAAVRLSAGSEEPPPSRQGRSKADTLFRTCEFLLTLFLAVAWSLIANPIIGALKMLGILKLASPPGDLRGKVAIVSGASTGIGRSTAAALAANGCTVVMAVRSLKRGEQAKRLIKEDIVRSLLTGPAGFSWSNAATGSAFQPTLFSRHLAPNRAETAAAGSLHVRLVELKDLESVRGFAAAFLSEFPKLDILVNNAGSGDRAKMRTKQGDEMIYGVNYFSHFLLTELLLPTLMSSPDAAEGVSQGWRYPDSKTAALFHALHLQRTKLKGSNVTALAVNPGFVHSDIWRGIAKKKVVGSIYVTLMYLFAVSTAQGCATSVAAATHALAPATRYLTPYWVPHVPLLSARINNKLFGAFDFCGPSFGALSAEPFLPDDEEQISARLFELSLERVKPFAAPLL